MASIRSHCSSTEVSVLIRPAESSLELTAHLLLCGLMQHGICTAPVSMQPLT